MGERKVSKIIYIIVALFLFFVMAKALLQSSNSSLKRISEELIECSDGKLVQENEGKLILITGIPSYDESYSLIDNDYNVEVNNAIYLSRNAYQYRYYKEKETYINDGENYDDYYVTCGWVESKGQKAETFYEGTEIYYNPDSNISSEIFSGYFNLGEFKLNADIAYKSQLVENNYYGLTRGGEFHVTTKNGIEYLSNMKEDIAEIGDYSINFTYYNFKYNQEYSFVGKQVGNTIERYESSNINVYDTYEGKYTKEELLNKLEEDYGNTKFGVVFVLIILILIGLYVFRDNLENLIDKIKKRNK